MTREEAIDVLKHNYPSDCFTDLCEAVEIAIKALSVQSERGRWIVVDDKYDRISGRCSVCGWEAHMYEDDVVGMDYCPNCGAEMEGEQND